MTLILVYTFQNNLRTFIFQLYSCLLLYTLKFSYNIVTVACLPNTSTSVLSTTHMYSSQAWPVRFMYRSGHASLHVLYIDLTFKLTESAHCNLYENLKIYHQFLVHPCLALYSVHLFVRCKYNTYRNKRCII